MLSNGDKQAPISVTTIPSEFATIPPMAFAVPSHVVALEPSGTTLSKPVAITLPNENHLPAGTQMVTMSMNSLTGKWELDGIAEVDANAQTVWTLPGQGITHISLVYFTPTFGPPAEVLGTNSPATESFSGTLSKKINLPSYQILGQSFTPTLLYNSPWAKPNAMVLNLFDLTPYQITKGQFADGVAHFETKSCFLFFCSADPQEAYYYSSIEEVAWLQPRRITAQFTSGTIQSPTMNFAGNPLLPSRSIVSYQMDLKDTESGEYFPSGLYPYSAKYQMYLDQLTMGTQTKPTWNPGSNSFDEIQTSLDSDTQLEDVFPDDLQGTLVVENERHSSTGVGWKVGGIQKIANPSEGKILIQEGDGSTSTFAINHIMNTLSADQQFPSGPYTRGGCIPRSGHTCPRIGGVFTFDMQSVGVSQWPNLLVSFHDRSDQTGVTTSELRQFDLTHLEEGNWETIGTGAVSAGGTLQLPDGKIVSLRQKCGTCARRCA